MPVQNTGFPPPREAKGQRDKSHPAARASEDDLLELSEDDHILCRNCGHPVTAIADTIAVQGQHQHTCINPAGITFIIRCFSRAGGCLPVGKSSQEFTWFPGFAWSFAICAKCLFHLGWFYQSAGGSFFGLVRDNLLERARTH